MFGWISMSLVESLNAASSPSVWGIVLLVIILIAVAVDVFARRMSVKVAMCQIFILDGDRQGNFIRIENAVAEAKSKGASIVCLPAAAILGWVNPDAHSSACAIPGQDSDRLCGLAKKYKTHLCIGIEEKEGDRLYNSAVLIDDRGNILLKYRQINIPPDLMNPPYTPGSDLAVVDTKLGRIGLLVCSDTHREDILDRMADLKPALLLAPYAYAEQEARWPEHGQQLQQVVTNAAMRTGAVVVGTNLIGRITNGLWAGRVYGGQSVAVDDAGKIIVLAKDRDRDICIISTNRRMK